jgi:hypothetical protein
MPLMPTPFAAPRSGSWRWRRILVAGVLAALGCIYFAHVEHTQLPYTADLDDQLYGARFLLEGRNPYALIGRGRAVQWRWGLSYPAPTLVALVPLARLSLPTARLVFVGITSFLFLYALGCLRGAWRFLAVLSKPYQASLLQVQWGFLFAAAWVLPAVAALAIVKPNIGVAVVCARLKSPWLIAALAGGTVLLIASVALLPTWPRDWVTSLGMDPTRRFALSRPGGFLLVLAALKWRRPEARLLLALSIIPQTLGQYDALLLFFIPDRASECIALVALSHFAYLMNIAADPKTINEAVVNSGVHVVVFIYLPALAMVLRRPNEGLVPLWLENMSGRLPAWLRGRATADAIEASKFAGEDRGSA